MVEDPSNRHPDRDIVDFVHELVVAMANTHMYWSDHPSVAAPVSELIKLLPEIVQRIGKTSLVLGAVKNHLIVDERALLGASLSAPRLIKAILERSSGGIVFEASASEEEFRNFLTVISRNLKKEFKSFVSDGSSQLKSGENTETINRELDGLGCRNIRLLPPYYDEQRVADIGRGGVASSLTLSTQLYQGLVDHMQGTSAVIGDGGRIEFERIQTIMEKVLGVMANDPGQMLQLAGYESYDAYTFGHSLRVCLLAVDLAASLTSNKDLLNRIGVAALLHDVGKTRLPHDVLHCKGDLSADQRREMEKHPRYGAEILLDHDNCDPMAYGVAFGHHRGVSLEGYPRMLQQVELSMATRIVEICDVYEALTAVRPYRPAMSPVQAFRTMLCMDGKFDRALLARFIRVHGVYPNGSEVRVSTGECARVVRQSTDPVGPLIRFETDREGCTLDEEHQSELDLSQPTDQPLRIAELVSNGIV